jgi:C4-dicarboxylate-specific signal transduction histidine kinase
VTARKEFEEQASKVEAVKKENEAISSHLREKEILIASLLKANRTSVTGALSAAIAHELNQPLGASQINIQFLKWKLNRNELTPEAGADTLAYLEGDNKRAADIIKSLRSIFLETEISYQRSDVSELIQNMLVIVRPELKKSNIELSLALCDIKDIPVNPVEIQQVILNLINNAIQALNKSENTHKIITLRSTHHGDVFRLSISDNGPDVPQHRQNNLFELLSGDKQTGMGLGLWLCQHIVTRHGGKLWHESNAGGGANFVLELPASFQESASRVTELSANK